MRQVIGYLLATGLGLITLSACTTPDIPAVVEAIKIQPPLVITSRQKEVCREVAPKLGDDKLSLIERANIEISDCEEKRAALQKTIEDENVKRAEEAEKEKKRLTQ